MPPSQALLEWTLDRLTRQQIKPSDSLVEGARDVHLGKLSFNKTKQAKHTQGGDSRG